ncbi:hypothetical protein LWI29_014451 [Acer saccharum]|uniref:Uncharacterized protein n=1 Tax=Acer saccharum TaxID=4024 RepID=A0AA39S7F7_ACESA|nr:hypothetical protein LWI29_014451 [Acer saccharum]
MMSMVIARKILKSEKQSYARVEGNLREESDGKAQDIENQENTQRTILELGVKMAVMKKLRSSLQPLFSLFPFLSRFSDGGAEEGGILSLNDLTD